MEGRLATYCSHLYESKVTSLPRPGFYDIASSHANCNPESINIYDPHLNTVQFVKSFHIRMALVLGHDGCRNDDDDDNDEDEGKSNQLVVCTHI